MIKFPATLTFGFKEIIKVILIFILVTGLFLAGRFSVAQKQSENRPTILSTKSTAVTIGLKGELHLYNYSNNTLIVLADSLSLQTWILYTSVVRNQATH